MRVARVITGVGAVLVCGCAAPPSPPPAQANATKTVPLILEKNEGERLVFRPWPGHPKPGAAFFLKVDPKNGGSSHLVFGTEDLPPGETIGTHRHPSADEIIFLQAGTARVHVGDSVRVVHAGATVFIPADTRISVSNIGRDALGMVFIFSAPGFEDFMRAVSVREGENNVPLSNAEDGEIQRKHTHDVVYQ
ncbi:MAG TPA: cupin domain-containing protein [Gemmatimonadales bacterium]